MLCLHVSAQTNDKIEPIQIKGIILSVIDSTPIAYVHIIDLTTGYGTAGDYMGEFSMRIYLGDTIRFSALGYKSLLLNLDEAPSGKHASFTIYMEEKVYDIPEIEVHPYPNFSDFKHAFLNLELPEDSFKVDLNLPEVGTSQAARFANGQVGLIIEGPFTAIYDKFSRKGKDKRAYDELMIRRTSYNAEVIKRVTGLTDPDQIISFMFFCDISTAFITQASDYEIIEAINKCFKEFTADN